MNKRVRHMQSAAVFMVLRKDAQVLLLQRKATGWMDGQYSLPAGALDAGETLREAAIREALEEVGIVVDASDAVHVHMLHCKTGADVWTGHFFLVNHWQGEPKICEPDKHADVMWCDMSALPENLIPYVRQALQQIALGKAYSEYGWDV